LKSLYFAANKDEEQLFQLLTKKSLVF